MKIIQETEYQSGLGRLYRHESGAQILHVKTSDTNKGFSIAFQTVPPDSKGALHIIEHIVLCGSRKYNGKDPFNELLKGTSHTYLNAITFHDKTMFPVAGTNMDELLKMADVYLDGVFHPRFPYAKDIFLQEGIHRIYDKSGKFQEWGGVVYNEMRGMYSDPLYLLQRMVLAELFPDHPYRYDAAGDPSEIPKTSLQECTELYERFYHPANGYFYLYGDMEPAPVFELLQGYIAGGKYIEPARIPIQEPFRHPVFAIKEHSFFQQSENQMVGSGVLLPKGNTLEKMICFQILHHYLLEAFEAPLQEYILQKSGGGNGGGYLEFHLQQVVYMVYIQNTKITAKDFQIALSQFWKDLVQNGFDRERLKAIINRFAYTYREESFGFRPKGIHYNILGMANWQYGNNPMDAFKILTYLDYLHDKVDNGFFENMVQEDLIENTHWVYIDPVHKDKKIYSWEKADQAGKRVTAEKVPAKEPGDTCDIPIIDLNAMKHAPEFSHVEEGLVGNTPLIFTPYAANGIIYLQILFDLSGLDENWFRFMGAFTALLGKMSTENAHYTELSKGLFKNTGGFSTIFKTLVSDMDGKNTPYLTVKVKMDRFSAKNALFWIQEILLNTCYQDVAQLRRILVENKLRMEQTIISQGQELALSRVMANVGGPKEKWNEWYAGITYYSFLQQVTASKQKTEILAKLLEKFASMVFTKERMIVTFSGEKGDYLSVKGILCNFCSSFPHSSEPEKLEESHLFPSYRLRPREAFIIPSNVQSNAAAGNYNTTGFDYKGGSCVLEQYLDSCYLLENVRVKGGAYGSYSKINRQGVIALYSFRDPQLQKTFDIMKGARSHTASISLSRKEIRQFIIGAINRMDRPLNGEAYGEQVFDYYLSDISQKCINNERKEILETSLESFWANSVILSPIEDLTYYCTLGDRKKIMENDKAFDEIYELLDKKIP